MMRENEEFVDLAFLGGSTGRRDSQPGWQNFIGRTLIKKSILDIGSGLGNSRPRLSQNENIVTLQEPAPELKADIKKDISKIQDNSFQYVTAFDVIEHIPDDKTFIKHMFRICKEGIFISTPNYNVFKCKNKYHIREYKPEELINLSETVSNKFILFVCNNTMGQYPQKLSKKAFLNTMHPALGILIKKV